METGLSRMSVQMVEINQRIDAQPFELSEKSRLNAMWILFNQAWQSYVSDQSRRHMKHLNATIQEFKTVIGSIRNSVKEEVGDSREVDVQYIFFYIDGLSDNLKAMGRFLKERAA
jgi:hypothetical protein